MKVYKINDGDLIRIEAAPLYGTRGTIVVSHVNTKSKYEISDKTLDLTTKEIESFSGILSSNDAIGIVGLLSPIPGKKEFGVIINIIIQDKLVDSIKVVNNKELDLNIQFTS